MRAPCAIRFVESCQGRLPFCASPARWTVDQAWAHSLGRRYCDRRLVPIARNFKGGRGFMRYDYSGGNRLYELHGLLVREVMIRRLKADVMSQLPPKRRQVSRMPWTGSGGGSGFSAQAATQV